jgi:hypothetical protein
MIASHRKGKHDELEVAALLRNLLGTAVVRNLTQVRDGGHDLLGLPGWSAEVKRACTPRVHQWWRQAVAQAGEVRPVLFYRLDRKPWRAVIALTDAVPGFEGQPRREVTPPVGRPADGGDRAFDVGFDLRGYRLVDLSDGLGARRRLGDALDVHRLGARGDQQWHDAEDRGLEIGQHAGGPPRRLDGEVGSVGREENTHQV